MKSVHWGLAGVCLASVFSIFGCSDSGAPNTTGAGATGGVAAGGASGAGMGGTAGTTGGAGSGGTAGASGSGGSSAGTAGAGGSAGSEGSGGGGTGGGNDGCSKALICDDFEDHPLDAAPGTPWAENSDDHGSVVVSSENSYSGDKAVRVTTDGLSSYQRAFFHTEGAPLFPAAKDMLWGRMMIFTEAAADDGVHWTMINGEGDVVGESYRALLRYGGQHAQKLMANYETDGASSDCWHHSQRVMPQGTWACLEWQFDVANDTMRFWIDDTAVDDLTVVAQNNPSNGDGCISNELGGIWNFPELDKLSLGWESYQTDPAREIWIDDVALGTERMGCP